MPRKLTLAEFIAKASAKHHDFYDYSLVDYTGINAKVRIICPDHGIFEMKASHHISGYRCHNCAKRSHLIKMKETNLRLYGAEFPLQSIESKKRMVKTNNERYGVGNPSKSKIVLEETWALKYGGHPFDLPGIRQQNSEKSQRTKLEKGLVIDPDARLDWKHYCRKVRSLTRAEYKRNKCRLNPDNLPISIDGYHVDHIFFSI